MMYQDKFAVALKSAEGKVLREFGGDKVYVPFGSEYTVFLKNMHDRRAVAQISIDGNDVGDGKTFVVPAYGQINIERFVDNGNMNAGNRFKFIERTDKVADHRGVDVEDGLVRITWQLEKKAVIAPAVMDFMNYNPIRKGRLGGNDVMRGITQGSYSTDVFATSTSQNEVGVTAPGSISEQRFTESDHFDLEPEKTVFVIQILGETQDNQYVLEPVTVKTQIRCSQCGTYNRPGTKFCGECGASLQRV